MAFIRFAWHGEEKLWVVFWIYGFLLLLFMKTLNSIMGMPSSTAHFIALNCLLLCYIIILWRCALNTKWVVVGYITRFLIVVSIIALIDIFISRMQPAPKGPVYIDYRNTESINRKGFMD